MKDIGNRLEEMLMFGDRPGRPEESSDSSDSQ